MSLAWEVLIAAELLGFIAHGPELDPVRVRVAVLGAPAPISVSTDPLAYCTQSPASLWAFRQGTQW
jgi:hypothetical protein